MDIDLIEKNIDAEVAKYLSDNTPGMSLLIAKDGRPLLQKTYGMADLEKKIPVKPEDHFIIASNTKQFTCLAILMLRERGLLDLDETIDRFFPDFPDYTKKITVRMLMSHTSGIMEYFEDDFFMKYEKRLRTADTADLLEIAKEYGDRLYFEPDTKLSYCNTGYVMLGDIVRQLSGKMFGQFLEEEVFPVIGMDDSVAPDYMDHGDPKVVPGYMDTKEMASEMGEDAVKAADVIYTDQNDGFGFVRMPYDMLEVGYADGNISTSAAEVLKWHNYLYDKDDDRLVPYEKRKEMWTPHVYNDGTESLYGMGLMLGDFDEDHIVFSEDKREIWHTGGSMGFISRISYLPDEKISAIMLTNWNGVARNELFRGIMKTFFKASAE